MKNLLDAVGIAALVVLVVATVFFVRVWGTKPQDGVEHRQSGTGDYAAGPAGSSGLTLRQVGRAVLVTTGMLFGLAFLALVGGETTSETSSSDGFESTASAGTSTFDVALAVVALLGAMAVLFLFFRWLSGPVLPDTPASGRWVALLRMLVDLTLGLTVVTVLGFAIGFVVSPSGLSYGYDRLNLGDIGISMKFEPGESKLVWDEELDIQRAGGPRAMTETAEEFRGWKRRFGRDIEVDGVRRVTLRDRHPTATTWGLAITTKVVGLAAFLGFLVALRGLLARAARGEPFDPRAVVSLQLMAFAIVAGTVAVRTGEGLVGGRLAHAGGGVDGVSSPIGFEAFGAAFLLLALAEVWRYGVALQTEVEATV